MNVNVMSSEATLAIILSGTSVRSACTAFLDYMRIALRSLSTVP